MSCLRLLRFGHNQVTQIEEIGAVLAKIGQSDG